MTMKNFLVCLFLIIFGAVVFGLVFRAGRGNPTPGVIKNTINNANKPYGIAPDRGRFILTQNLVENRSFSLNREQADAGSPDMVYYKGSWHVAFAPGISIFAIPFYFIGSKFNLGFAFTFLLSTLFALANLALIFLISKKILNMPHWASLFAALIFGFSSTALSYVTSLYQHQAAAFFILSSFYAVYKYKMNLKWGFLWGIYVWVAYALAIACDYPNAILLFPIMVYFVIVSLNFAKDNGKYKISLRPAIILTSVFFIALTILHGYYNYKNFGGWTKLSGGLVSYNTIVRNELDKGDLEENVKKIDALQNKINVIRAFREQSLINSGYELLFAPDKGIFIFNPIFILAVLGIYYGFKKIDLEKAILISLIAVNLFLYSSWGDPWGGWAFGPRYLIPSMAILAIFACYFLVSVRFKVVSKLFAFVLFVFSAAVSVLGAVTTNAVPPKSEAVVLHSKYGMLYTLDFLKAGIQNNFAFNSFFHKYFSLYEYYFIVLGIVVFAGFVILFILPRFEKHDNI